MKISMLVRADNGGLGTLSRMFYENLPSHRVLAISAHEGEAHFERFPGCRIVPQCGISHDDAAWLCEGADVVLSHETTYGPILGYRARAAGCKLAITIMYECMSQDTDELRCTDLAVCPTGLDLVTARDQTPGLAGAIKTMLPIPFDTARIPFHQRERARVFLHHAGHQGGSGRNGTAEVLAAWREHVKSEARLVVRSQEPLMDVPSDPRITYQTGATADYWDRWDEQGDVFLLPTKWDALSLPMQEACCAGKPVMTTRFWPHCDFPKELPPYLSGLSKGWLPPSSQELSIPVHRVGSHRICRQFRTHEVSPEGIATVVDCLYDRDISQASRDAREVAEKWSWEKLGPQWLRLFEDIVAGRSITDRESELP